MTPLQINTLAGCSAKVLQDSKDETVAWLVASRMLEPNQLGCQELTLLGQHTLRKYCQAKEDAIIRKAVETWQLDIMARLTAIEKELSKDEPEPKKEIEPGFYRVGQWSIFKKPMICVYVNDDGALKYYYTGMDRDITYNVSQLDEIPSLTPIKWVDA